MEKSVYLDNNATTKVDKEVVESMMKYLKDDYGNPSSLYTLGQNARSAVEDSRKRVASILNCEPRDVFFTGSGTESDNIAVKGVARRYKNKGNHIITSAIEHHAVLKSVEHLAKEGFTYDIAKVGEDGIVDVDHLKSLIKPETILISVMYANNETGAIQPIEEIGKIAKEREIYFHTDAVQGAGKLTLDVKKLNVDMLSLSGHKFHAPKGIGILYKRTGINPIPLFHGGHHELSVRPSTENVPYIVAVAKALEIAYRDIDEHRAKQTMLKERLKAGITKNIGNILLNTPDNSVFNTLNISFVGIEGESILFSLDEFGIAVSTGSACTSGSLEASHVIMAMGRDHTTSHGSVRFSLSKYTTEEEIDYTIDKVKSVVEKIRKISPYK
ncbi:TPA: cysteine desulfurase NifS [candidate division WOR-3 bacterium]|jgi:cysteine desulfurase|uniref:cysteine desulfurase n=1 Tax=candidate division WOR-3 bacterium TaxID=2052148 RepID=A0A350HBQ6_UNCW3|nr:cysteine desulfurase NifS [candidate division WOR-3 bacterium]